MIKIDKRKQGLSFVGLVGWLVLYDFKIHALLDAVDNFLQDIILIQVSKTHL